MRLERSSPEINVLPDQLKPVSRYCSPSLTLTSIVRECLAHVLEKNLRAHLPHAWVICRFAIAEIKLVEAKDLVNDRSQGQ